MKPFAARLIAASLVLAVSVAAASPPTQSLHYRPARRDGIVDNYFGTRVPAPYQWMENMHSPALHRWVAAENRLTDGYLAKIPSRTWITRRLTQIWNYPKEETPVQVAGSRIFFMRNSGVQNQSVLYVQDSPSTSPRVLIDPNQLSPDGSLALTGFQPSPDGRYVAYALSKGGSDWETVRVLDVSTGKTLPDTLQWVKYSGMAWTHDDRGLFYSRFPTPAKGSGLYERNVNQQLYYHVLGKPQSADTLIYQRPGTSYWFVLGGVSEDGRYLFVALVKGAGVPDELYYADLGNPDRPDVTARLEPLYTHDDAQYSVVGVSRGTLYLETTLGAPRGRIVATTLADPAPAHWRTVVPEEEGVIRSASMADGRIIVRSELNAVSRLTLYTIGGKRLRDLPLPSLGTVTAVSSRDDSNTIYYGFTSFLYPQRIYRYEVQQGSTRTAFAPQVRFDPSQYEVRQVFYRSKDGTRVPMFIIARKDVKLDGLNPTILWGYGGFDITIMPAFFEANFMPMIPVWLELGGVYAVPNLRGGGLYGEKWHQAGMLSRKQNVFDDFAWAAKYLIGRGYTNAKQLGIWGYSNGGLLTGASLTEHPSLFGAAYVGHGVLDMLRYQRFSVGALWEHEYGVSSNPQAFKWLYAYSPLQNIHGGTCYPPTFITTSWDDDRVPPMHEFKFAAALQHAQACANPILLHTTAASSHTYMATDEQISQQADVWAFEAYNLGVRLPENVRSVSRAMAPHLRRRGEL
ncbi:MAG: prolyl oligopeptidase family serine peptidase [Chloroflexota bacterium]